MNTEQTSKNIFTYSNSNSIVRHAASNGATMELKIKV